MKYQFVIKVPREKFSFGEGFYRDFVSTEKFSNSLEAIKVLPKELEIANEYPDARVFVEEIYSGRICSPNLL